MSAAGSRHTAVRKMYLFVIAASIRSMFAAVPENVIPRSGVELSLPSLIDPTVYELYVYEEPRIVREPGKKFWKLYSADVFD
jgi:hypothetical protein